MTHRDELLHRMRTANTELESVVAALSGQLDAGLGDGWRVIDLLAHLALWERVANWKLTGSPVPHAADLIDREPWDLDAFNEEMRERWRSRSSTEVLNELRAAHETLVATVASASDEECATGGRVWAAIDLDGAGHYEQHLPTLRSAREA